MSEKESTPEADSWLKHLTGDPSDEQKRLLFHDWTFFISCALFINLCNQQSNPRAFGRSLIAIWRKRMDDGMHKEFDSLNNLRADPIVSLLGGMINDQSSIEGTTQDNLNEVTAELLAIVEKLPEVK